MSRTSERVQDLAARIADTVFSGDGRIKRLCCGVCGSVQKLDALKAASYFENGWPACCGQTMSLEEDR